MFARAPCEACGGAIGVGADDDLHDATDAVADLEGVAGLWRVGPAGLVGARCGGLCRHRRHDLGEHRGQRVGVKRPASDCTASGNGFGPLRSPKPFGCDHGRATAHSEVTLDVTVAAQRVTEGTS